MLRVLCIVGIVCCLQSLVSTKALSAKELEQKKQHGLAVKAKCGKDQSIFNTNVNSRDGFGNDILDEIPVDGQNGRKRRSAIADEKRWWPINADGNVYIAYEFGHRIPDIMQAFHDAIRDFNNRTCIRLIPKQAHHVDYLNVVSDSGCYVFGLGYRGGAQLLSLETQTFCATKSTAIHELMHILGFHHEMNRRDRSNYIYVYPGNIASSAIRQFEVHEYANGLIFGTEYDKKSVMHYGRNAGSNGNGPAMVSKTDFLEKLGNDHGFTEKDIQKINRMYCPHIAGSV